MTGMDEADDPRAVVAELERRGLRVTRAGDVPDAEDLRCVGLAEVGDERVTAAAVNRARLADAMRREGAATGHDATLRRMKDRLRYWADQIEGDVDWSRGDIYRALDEMRQTAEEL